MTKPDTAPGAQLARRKTASEAVDGERDILEQEFEALVDFLKVMADRSRLRILGLLSEREYTVKEIASVLGLKEPTVSLHLNMLKSRDMVKMRKEGTSHFYSLSQESIFSLLKEVAQKANAAEEGDPNSTDFERHVLRHFFVNGKLKQLPTKQSKTMVILRRLAREFQPGSRYHEKDVNAILKQFYPDWATLRRLLVDNRLMARKDSVYWRIDSEETPSSAAQQQLDKPDAAG